MRVYRPREGGVEGPRWTGRTADNVLLATLSPVEAEHLLSAVCAAFADNPAKFRRRRFSPEMLAMGGAALLSYVQ